jgi:hypothetical protein
MAYPDYSIVIISVTTGGVTTDYASSFYNEQLAQKFYDKAISEGKRAFYFEKPTPSKFARNDAQPLKQNTEAGLENAPVPSVEENSQPVQSLGEIAEEVYHSAEKTFTDAVGTIRTYQKFQIEVAKRYFDTFYVGPFKFFKKVFNRVVNEPAEVVVAIDIITNKKITVKHNGNGGFNIVVEKLWPDKGETLLDDAGEILITLIEDYSVIGIGTKQLKKVFGGASISDFVLTEINNYIPEGTIVYETDYKIYRSDGHGWVTVENKEQPPVDPSDPDGGDDENNPCPSSGTEVSRVWIQDAVYPIVTDTGLETFVVTGGQYSVTVVNDQCGYDVYVEYTYTPSGTVLYETDTNFYKSSGDGGVYSESKDNDNPDDDDGDNENNGDNGNDCNQQAGEFIRTEQVEGSAITTQWFVGDQTGSYQSSVQERDITTDGQCGENEGSETTKYIDENSILANVNYGGFNYVVYTTSNGGWTYAESWNSEQSDDTSGDSDVPDGNFEFPSNEPCTPAGYGDKISTSCFKSTPSGDIVGMLRERKINVSMPSGVYTTSISTGAGMPPSVIEVSTGHQWFGRYLADGQCGWTPETPNVPETWRFPNQCLPDGYYSNKHTIVPNPVVWVFSEFNKMENGQKKYKPYRAYIYHDGQGNVSIQSAG